MQLDKLNPNMT